MNIDHRNHPLFRTAVFIFALAAIVRIVHVVNVSSTPVFELYLGDSLAYHEWAVEIAEGNVAGDEVFYQAPLYPYSLGLIYSIFGAGRWTAVIFQLLLSSFSCVMLFDAARRFTSTRAAAAAGILLALYAPAIFFDAVIQKPSLVVFFLTMVLMLLGKWQQRPRTSTAVCLGTAVGCLVLCRENAVLIAAAIAVGIVCCNCEPDRRTRWRAVVLFSLGISVALLPVALRNKIVGGEFVLTTSQFGPNFYIGNGAAATGMYQPLAFGGGNAEYERSDATRIAEEALERRLRPSEVSSYWFHRTIDDTREAPARWLRLMGYKALLAVNRIEVTDTEDMYSYAEWSLPLNVLVPVSNFGLIFPLGTVGICLSFRDKNFRTVLLFLPAYFVGLWCFYVMSRYRLPLAPILMIFAGIAITEGGRRWKHSSGRDKLTTVIFGLLSIGLSFWPVIDSAKMQSVTQYNLALHFDVQGQPDQAVCYYRRTLELNSEDADAWANLGDVLARQGKYEEAVAALKNCVQLAPSLPVPHFWLAQCLEKTERPNDALSHYRQAVRLAPDLPDPLIRIGIILKQRQDLKNAEAAFRSAVQAAPDFVPALANLGVFLMESGNAGEAAACFERALRVEPHNAVIRNLLTRSQQLNRNPNSTDDN